MNRRIILKSGLFLFLVLFFSSPVFSYQPGKWSHTDPFVLKAGGKGPRELKVVDESGKLLQRAVYEYRADGRLFKEKYYNGKGDYTGYADYDYDSVGVLRRESLFDQTGKLLNRTAYSFKGGQPQSIGIYDEKGTLIITMDFNIQNGVVIGGQERSGQTIDKYSFEYVDQQLSTISIFGEENVVIARVLYAYQNGKLQERRREQGPDVSTCRYEYSGDRLSSYTYFNLEEGKWVFDKKLILEY